VHEQHLDGVVAPPVQEQPGAQFGHDSSAPPDSCG